MQFTPPSPQQIEKLNVAIALHQQGRLAEAEPIYRECVALKLALPQPYANLAAIVLTSQGREAALQLWGIALTLDPNHLDSLIALGMTLREMGEQQRAIACYRRALQLQPNLPQVSYNLGNILQQRGEHNAAAECYQQALHYQADFALAFYNLANIRRQQGQLDAAIKLYRRAIAAEPDNPLYHNNLGNALIALDQLEPAIAAYQAALRQQPDYSDAIYNLANAVYLDADLPQAMALFDRAGIRDWRSRALYCCYKINDSAGFTRRLQDCLGEPHLSPQIAALSAHNACNLGISDNYSFCPRPLDYIYQANVQSLASSSSPLARDLRATLANMTLDARHQGRLHNGVQSSGHLFLREEKPLQDLAQLVRVHIEHYLTHYAGADCTFISHFPIELVFESAWTIRMHEGGHLDGHIHETGWLSGVVYLDIPPRPEGSNEGCISFSLHGDNYPRDHADFPERTLLIAPGDIVLFPSSLFHRTIPFNASAERVCVAFDLQPPAQ